MNWGVSAWCKKQLKQNLRNQKDNHFGSWSNILTLRAQPAAAWQEMQKYPLTKPKSLFRQADKLPSSSSTLHHKMFIFVIIFYPTVCIV